MGKFFDFIIPFTCITGMAACAGLIIHLAVYGDKYHQANSKYECFIDGDSIYKDNERPKHLGDNWYLIKNEKKEVDACFCNGCIGF